MVPSDLNGSSGSSSSSSNWRHSANFSFRQVIATHLFYFFQKIDSIFTHKCYFLVSFPKNRLNFFFWVGWGLSSKSEVESTPVAFSLKSLLSQSVVIRSPHVVSFSSVEIGLSIWLSSWNPRIIHFLNRITFTRYVPEFINLETIDFSEHEFLIIDFIWKWKFGNLQT